MITSNEDLEREWDEALRRLHRTEMRVFAWLAFLLISASIGVAVAALTQPGMMGLLSAPILWTPLAVILSFLSLNARRLCRRPASEN